MRLLKILRINERNIINELVDDNIDNLDNIINNAIEEAL